MALLTPDAAAVVAVAAAAGAAVALLLGLAAHFRIGRARRAYADMLGGSHGEHIVDVVGDHVRSVEQLRDEVAGAQRALAVLRSELADAVRHVAVVRYDAFGDMGGRMSFSAAMLDDSGDGLVISAINGRSETRSYAKGVKAGTSTAELSPEEQKAIEYAMTGEPTPKRRAATTAG